MELSGLLSREIVRYHHSRAGDPDEVSHCGKVSGKHRAEERDDECRLLQHQFVSRIPLE
jgi:hypothetical protein